MFSRSALAEQFAQGLGHVAGRSTRSGCSACRRANASSRRVSSDAAPGRLLGTAQRPFAQRARSPDWARTCSPLMIDRQQVVEVVCDAAGKLADRLQFLHLEQFGLRLGARRRLGLDPPVQIGVDPFQFGVCLTSSAVRSDTR